MRAGELLAAVRGLAGAALGGWLAARLWLALPVGLADGPLRVLAAAGLLLFCPAAYFGYWCFRGLRRRRFACCAVWGCAFAALPLAVRPDSPGVWVSVCLVSALAVLMSRALGWESFLRYTDPAWYKDPRRFALKRRGAAFANHWQPDTGYGGVVPASFSVNEGGGGRVISVQGGSIRVEPRLRRGRSFFVRDAAGLLIGPSNGHNVLYDAQNEALVSFAMVERNADIFVQYLREHGVPFRRLEEGLPERREEPEELQEAEGHSASGGAVRTAEREGPERREEAEEKPIRHTTVLPVRYTLRLRRTKPVGVWIAAGTALGMALFFFGFPAAAMLDRGGRLHAVEMVMVLSIGSIIAPFAAALLEELTYPSSLEVEGDRVWVDTLLSCRQIRMEDIGGLRYDCSDECYILCDKQEKLLAKFSTRDEFGPQFMNFLTDHSIRLSK